MDGIVCGQQHDILIPLRNVRSTPIHDIRGGLVVVISAFG